MLVIIDNYDSFTYNIYKYLGELGADVTVFRNNKITVEELAAMQPEKILISPGPCTPKEAGISCETIQYFAGKIPILGVCLGHQSIGYVFGGNVIRARRLMHGKTSPIHHKNTDIFAGMPEPFDATRYHSLVIEKETCPDCLEITAWAEEDEIMGVRHKEHPIYGVQFHPESILTTNGKQLLQNFLDI